MKEQLSGLTNEFYVILKVVDFTYFYVDEVL
jgi:hypothetical protein